MSSPGYNYSSLPVGDAYDPDVVLAVDISGNIHAMVAYYRFGLSGYFIADYIWSGGGFVLAGTPWQIDSQILFGTAINIDTDYNGNFVVVWDVAGVPYATQGSVTMGYLNVYSSPIAIGTARTGTFPDVCVYENAIDLIVYCYIGSNGDLYVDTDSFYQLGNPSYRTNVIHNPNTNTYIAPRIACPFNYPGQFTVVVLHINTTNSFIVEGFCSNNNGINNVILNDGHWGGGCDLTGIDCYGPVVAYDDMANVLVGFNVNNLGGVNSPPVPYDAIFPVVLNCDYDCESYASIDY